MAGINPFAMYQSTGQNFRRVGARGGGGLTAADFGSVREDLDVMSSRLTIAGEAAAIDLADKLVENTKQSLRELMPPRGTGYQTREERRASTGEPFEFSKGRLMAAWGRYESQYMDEATQEKHEQWASENDVQDEGSDELESGERVTEEMEMGAVYRVRRYRGSNWTAEVGTLLPYAGLANDGGSMMILPYGNMNAEPVQAHWEGVHFVEDGASRTEAEIDNHLGRRVDEALS